MKHKHILFLLILLGFLLRIVYLNVSPSGFNADEAALGYNAYSILKTGKDEWGQTFPIVFKSFSDYKPGLYVYLAIPFVWLLGLTEVAVRLPSIILGTLSILFIYFLSKEIFKQNIAALATAFLLAISPWHIHFSRGAWETNIATFFILLGVLAFIKGLKIPMYYYLSAVSFAASVYAYQSTRLITPLLLLGIFIIFIRQIKLKQVLIPSILGIILLVPLSLIIFSNQGLSRFQGVSIFSDKGPINRLNEERGEHEAPNGIVAKLTHNKLTVFSYDFIGNYFDHLSPDFLFVSGDPLKRNKIPEVGQIYLFETVTLLFGFILLIKYKYSNLRVVILWLLIAPIAAALTYQSPHSLRSHNMVIPLTLISGLGLGLIIQKISYLKYKRVIFTFASLIIFYFLSLYLHEYYIHLPKQYALDWEYGFSKVVPFVFEQKEQYDKVIFTDRYDQPYILVLFYSKYDPRTYQSLSKTERDNGFGFTTITEFDKFEFRRVGEIETRGDTNKIFVSSEEFTDPNKIPRKVIYFPDGNIAFKVLIN